MTTPQDPRGEGRPQAGSPYGRSPEQAPPEPYRRYGPPGPYGGQAYPGPPYGGGPPHGAGNTQGPSVQGPYAQGPYAYNPYGTPYPAGLDAGDVGPVARPWPVVVALVLLILSALPYLLFGAALVLLARTAVDALPADTVASVRETGFDPVSFLQILGAVLVVPALLHLLLAVVAFRRSNAARIFVTVLTAGFTLFTVASVAIALGGSSTTGALDVASLLILAVPLLLAVVGVGLLYRSDARGFYANPRR